MIKKAKTEKLTLEDMGCLSEHQKIENRIEKVQEIYDSQQNKNILFAIMKASKEQYIFSLFIGVMT